MWTKLKAGVCLGAVLGRGGTWDGRPYLGIQKEWEGTGVGSLQGTSLPIYIF